MTLKSLMIVIEIGSMEFMAYGKILYYFILSTVCYAIFFNFLYNKYYY